MGVKTCECPDCGGIAQCMGKIAKLFNFRCRICGFIFQVTEKDYLECKEDES